jgi:hypothetical protein
MAIIFTVAWTGECSPYGSLFSEIKAYQSMIEGAYNKVGLKSQWLNHPMGAARFIP